MKRLVSISIIAILGGVAIASIPYTWVAENLTLWLIPPDKQTIFLTQYFSPTRFRILQVFAFFTVISLSVGYYHQEKIKQRLLSAYKILWQETLELLGELTNTYHSWDKNTRYGFWWVLVLVTAVRLYFALFYPIHIDEAFSYVFFASKGLLVSAMFYPGPNNHVGYTLWVAFLAKFLPALWAIRLPVLVQSFLATVAGYAWAANRYGALTAVSIVVLFSFSEYGLFYAVHGRGYWAVACATFVALWAIESQYQNPQKRIYYAIGSIACIYGFYSVPVFLYSFIGIAFWGVYRISTKNFVGLSSWLGASVAVVGITSLLYLPILIFNDWQTITGNPWVLRGQQTFWQDYTSYLVEVNAAFYGTEKAGFGIVLLLWAMALVGVFIRPYRAVSMLVIFLGIFPFGLIIWQKVLPFTRVWLYKSMLEYALIGILIGKISAKSSSLRTCIILFLVAYSSFQVYTHYKRLHQDKVIYQNATTCARLILQHKPIKVFANHDLYQVILRYEALQVPMSLPIETKDFDGTADMLIASKKTPLSITGKLIWEDDEVAVWHNPRFVE